MLNQKPLNELIFIDIETSSQYPTFADIENPLIKELFLKKFEKEIDNLTKDYIPSATLEEMKLNPTPIEQVYSLKAPLLAEFGKVIAISIGVLTESTDGIKLQTLNLSGDDEKALLTDFLLKCKKISEPKTIGQMKHTIVAYNGLVFDIPSLKIYLYDVLSS